MAKGPPIVALVCALVLVTGCGSSSSSSSTSAAGVGSSTSATGASSSTSAAGASSTPSSTQASSTGPSSKAQLGFEGMPIEQGTELAPASTTGTAPVDGIKCAPTEQLVYHIHAHLAVYDNGALRALPGGVGIPGSQVRQTTEGPVALGGRCVYWLHTHAPDGVIHVESPAQRVYTLGNFFDEWRQPLSRTRVGTVKGRVTAFVDGKVWTKDPRAIPLIPHAVIQLGVGQPAVPFQPVSWNGTNL